MLGIKLRFLGDTRMKKYFYLFLLCVSFALIQLVSFAEVFQNSLLKMDFYRMPSGNVKIALYTSKPYEDSINVNKKSDFEYIILLPETSNSMTANPVLNSVLGIVKAVNVRTQQYENQVKGYTKITISTLKPVEIIPQVQTLSGSDYQLSERDYNELLSQTSKKSKIPVKKEIKQQVKKEITQPAVRKTINKLVQKPKLVSAPAFIKVEKKLRKPKLTHNVNKRSLLQSPTAPLAKSKGITAKPKIAEKPQIAAEKSQIAGVGSSIQQNIVNPVAQKDIYTPVDETPKVKTEVKIPSPVSEKISAPAQKISRFRKYKNIIINNLYLILGSMFAAFILLLLVARKSVKNVRKQKESFINNLKEEPSPVTDYSQNISEDMTWKEKFQTYVDTVQKSSSEAEDSNAISAVADKELDELFKDELSESNIAKENPINEDINTPLQNENAQYEDESSGLLVEDEIPENELLHEEVLEQGKLNELFGEDDFLNEEDNSIFIEEVQENFPFESQENKVEESSEVIKSEFSIDNNKGFYLVDFDDKTALVGHIEDEIFILKCFKEKIDGTLQARLDERKASSTNYMTKIGDFRALVEVTPTNMNLLIEL